MSHYDALLAAARAAVAHDGGIAYNREDDEIGYRPCCQVLEYQPHAPDCHITRLQSAIQEIDRA